MSMMMIILGVLILAAILAGAWLALGRQGIGGGEAVAAATEPRWVREISPEQVAQRLTQGEPLTVLDVREESEWSVGHIPGAVWIPLGVLPARIRELDAGKPVAVVCHSGGRSAKAAEFLLRQGFGQVYNMSGGMKRWTGPVKR